MLLAASGVWIWTTIAIVIWVLLAFWPARVAARKGHSFFGYFLFSIVMFPVALIVAYVVGDRTAGSDHGALA
jgi:cadmium resistance protein CadD (predicted permease)